MAKIKQLKRVFALLSLIGVLMAVKVSYKVYEAMFYYFPNQGPPGVIGRMFLSIPAIYFDLVLVRGRFLTFTKESTAASESFKTRTPPCRGRPLAD